MDVTLLSEVGLSFDRIKMRSWIFVQNVETKVGKYCLVMAYNRVVPSSETFLARSESIKTVLDEIITNF